jgi:hypothetical protein
MEFRVFRAEEVRVLDGRYLNKTVTVTDFGRASGLLAPQSCFAH